MDFPYDQIKLQSTMNQETPEAPARRRKRDFASFQLAPLKPEQEADTTQNRAYRALKTAILGGTFYPGTPVTLAKLSDMLGTSEMPVREALKRLTAEGAFEALPNRSARIPILSKPVVKQILDLRVELEGRAAAQAVEHLTKRTIDRAAANEPLLSLIEALWLRMAPVVAFNLTEARNAAAQFDRVGRSHHGNIVKAFQAQDPGRAAREIRADLLHPSTFTRYFDELPTILSGAKPRS